MEYTVCPEEPKFQFQKTCPIKTCQYNTSCTRRGCLSLDRKESSTKAIGDIELYHYKCKEIPELAKLSVKQIGALRRKYVIRVKNIMALYAFVRHIEDHCDERVGTVYVPKLSSSVDSMLTSGPLSLKTIGFKPWMLRYIVDESLFKKFMGLGEKTTPGDINLKQMLDLTPTKYRAFEQDVLFMSNPKNATRINSSLNLRN